MSEPTQPVGPPADTTDVREGPEVDPGILSLLPLLGTWRGEGQGDYPTTEGFRYGQEVRFWHDGRPFLCMESRTWVIDDEGTFLRSGPRETGYWRAGQGDDIELVLVHETGVAEVYLGQARTTTSWELVTDVIARTASSQEEVSGVHRLYGIVEGELMYAIDMAAAGHTLQPYMSARLARVQ